MVRRKCNDRVEQRLTLIVHRDFEERRLQEVTRIVLERIVVMRKRFLMVLQERSVFFG